MTTITEVTEEDARAGDEEAAWRQAEIEHVLGAQWDRPTGAVEYRPEHDDRVGYSIQQIERLTREHEAPDVSEEELASYREVDDPALWQRADEHDEHEQRVEGLRNQTPNRRHSTRGAPRHGRVRRPVEDAVLATGGGVTINVPRVLQKVREGMERLDSPIVYRPAAVLEVAEGALCLWCGQEIPEETYGGRGRPQECHPGECRRLYDNWRKRGFTDPQPRLEKLPEESPRVWDIYALVDDSGDGAVGLVVSPKRRGVLDVIEYEGQQYEVPSLRDGDDVRLGWVSREAGSGGASKVRFPRREGYWPGHEGSTSNPRVQTEWDRYQKAKRREATITPLDRGTSSFSPHAHTDDATD